MRRVAASSATGEQPCAPTRSLHASPFVLFVPRHQPSVTFSGSAVSRAWSPRPDQCPRLSRPCPRTGAARPYKKDPHEKGTGRAVRGGPGGYGESPVEPRTGGHFDVAADVGCAVLRPHPSLRMLGRVTACRGGRGADGHGRPRSHRAVTTRCRSGDGAPPDSVAAADGQALAFSYASRTVAGTRPRSFTS
jgi:hypothetical protein